MNPIWLAYPLNPEAARQVNPELTLTTKATKQDPAVFLANG